MSIFKQMLTGEAFIVAYSLHELRLAAILFLLALKHTDSISVFPSTLKMQASHSEVIKNYMLRMVSERISKTATSPWGFPVVIVKMPMGGSSFV